MEVYNKRNQIISNIIGIVIGILFIVSAWTKTYPIDSFEYIINAQLGLSKSLSAILARIMIGLEYALGIFLTVHFLLKRKWVVVSGILLLIAFSIHLLFLWINEGSDVNCGCMGDVVRMNPIESIIKNIACIIALWMMLRFTQGSAKVKLHNIWLLFVTLISMAIIFVAFSIKNLPEHLSYHLIYDENQPEQPKVNLKEGKHIVAYMTLGCGHCRTAAKEFANIKQQHPDYPIYFIMYQPDDTTGLATKKEDFLMDTKSENIPQHFLHAQTFVSLIEETNNNGTPVILWMQDSAIIREVPNGSINAEDIAVWLKK